MPSHTHTIAWRFGIHIMRMIPGKLSTAHYGIWDLRMRKAPWYYMGKTSENTKRAGAYMHQPFCIFTALAQNVYIPICFATSSAKFSSFFSRPSPVSKRTKPLILILAPLALATSATYALTDCFPSSAFT